MKKKGPKYKSWENDEKADEVPAPYTSKVVELFDRIKVKVPFKKLSKIGSDEEIVLSDETKAFLEGEREKCFLCKIILEDQEKNGKLTGDPKDGEGKPMFPPEAKVRHVQIEKLYERKGER